MDESERRRLRDLIPSSKFDRDAAQRAVDAGWPAVEPILPELLEWIQDCNWPVARTLEPLLVGIGEPIAPYLRPILDGDDLIWKYWVIVAILGHGPPSLVEAFRPYLERVVESPTPDEAHEELPEEAARVLERFPRE